MNKNHLVKAVRFLGLSVLYIAGVLSITATDHTGSGGANDDPSPPEPPGPVTDVDADPIVVSIGEIQEITFVAKDASGQVVTNVEASFELTGKILAEIVSNSVKGIAAGSDELIVKVDGAPDERVPVTIKPTPPPLIEVPLLWPVDRVKDEMTDRELLSQGFNEYNDGSANRFHAGWDIRGDEDVATVRAVADGWLHFIQEVVATKSRPRGTATVKDAITMKAMSLSSGTGEVTVR